MRRYSLSGALAPPGVQMDGALPSRVEPPGLAAPRRMEAPPSPAISTRRAALLKRSQNINCSFSWRARVHVISNTLLFYIMYLVFFYNEHM